MGLRGKLLFAFVLTALLVILIFGGISYRIASDWGDAREVLFFQGIIEDEASTLSNTSFADSDVLSAFLSDLSHVFLGNNSLVIFVDSKENLIFGNSPKSTFGDGFTSFPVAKLLSIGQSSGRFEHLEKKYFWALAAIPKSNAKLLVIHHRHNNPIPIFETVGVQFLIAGALVIWIAIWGALIVSGSMAKRLNQAQHDLVEARIERGVAEGASQSKSDFIANVSHEIRTPLTPIIGFAESMLQDDLDRDTCKSLLSAIVRNGRHLFNIINEILDLSKIEADKLEIEKVEVDTSQLFHDVESVIGTLAREKGLEFRAIFTNPVPRRISSDPTRIRQILMNLLTNAVKFTEKGAVGLYLEFDAEQKLLHFTVSDTGIGVSEDDLERLFKAFSQADASTTRRFGGTGLGLHISQRLANLLGGDITVTSHEGVGSKFVVTIVAEGEHLGDLISSPNPETSAAYSSTGIVVEIPMLAGHVLLAEDTPDNQRLISYYITKTGAAVSVAENGQIALEMALANDYDLVLMDMQMPVMGGAEAVEMLRATGCQTPVVALTANAMKGDLEKYTRIGCNGFMGKPIKQFVFYQTLAKYLPVQADDRAGDQVRSVAAVDEEFLVMQAEFLASLSGYAGRLREAMAQHDYLVVAEQAHVLKGMGGSFGFQEITNRAAKLETAMKNADYSNGKKLCDQLCEFLVQCAATRSGAV